MPTDFADFFGVIDDGDLEAVALACSIRNREAFLRGLPAAGQGDGAPGQAFPDPTAGATHFHRHDQPPPWWAIDDPVALIGDYFFYDLREHAAFARR